MADGARQKREARLEGGYVPSLRDKIPDVKITPEELDKHDKDDDLWIAFHGLVWDVTSWASKHPGGKGVLKAQAGDDGTGPFKMIHGGKDLMLMLAEENSKDVILKGVFDAPMEDEGGASVVKEYFSPIEKTYEYEVKGGATEFTDEIEFSLSQIVKTTSQGPTTTLFISGQTADGETLDMNVKSQADKALESMRTEVEKAGASMDDIVKVNAYIVGLDESKVGMVAQALDAAFKTTDRGQRPASTWIGCTGLAIPKAQVEIEAIAVMGAASKL